MILDYTRGTYTAPLVLEDGRRVKIRWYRASPGAQRFPHPTVLRQKSFWKQDPTGPRGEQATRTWHADTNYLHLPGTEFHGDPGAFVRLTSTPTVTPCGHWRIPLGHGHRWQYRAPTIPDAGCLPILADEDTPILATDDTVILSECGCTPIAATDDLPLLATEDSVLLSDCHEHAEDGDPVKATDDLPVLATDDDVLRST